MTFAEAWRDLNRAIQEANAGLRKLIEALGELPEDAEACER